MFDDRYSEDTEELKLRFVNVNGALKPNTNKSLQVKIGDEYEECTCVSAKFTRNEREEINNPLKKDQRSCNGSLKKQGRTQVFGEHYAVKNKDRKIRMQAGDLLEVHY